MHFCLQRGIIVALVGISAGWVPSAWAHTASEEMRAAADHWLSSLTAEQRSKATFEFGATERENWHFIPRDRKGLPLKEMTPAQQHLAHALLASGMSQRGYVKATTIMSLEEILKDIEKGSGPVRDPERYFVSIFGEPSPTKAWGWRVEGHHLSVNFTIVDEGHIASTPSFFGSNPGEVREGPRRGLRVLSSEEDMGRELARSLSAPQLTVALISETAPNDIVTSTNRHLSPLSPAGLAVGQMNAKQKDSVKALVREFVLCHRPEIAEMDMKRIDQAGWNKIHFAWAGSLEPGQAHYYRLQGPTFIMEYDDTQNKANHIHTVWRDFNRDFGDDILARHYQQEPHNH